MHNGPSAFRLPLNVPFLFSGKYTVRYGKKDGRLPYSQETARK